MAGETIIARNTNEIDKGFNLSISDLDVVASSVFEGDFKSQANKTCQ